jgi:hypothetical protein
MPVPSALYRRLRIAVQNRDALQESAKLAAVMLAADPENIRLDVAVTRVGEDLLRAREKVEYLEALVDTHRAYPVRPEDALTPDELLATHLEARIARDAFHKARAGIVLMPELVDTAKAPKALKAPKAPRERKTPQITLADIAERSQKKRDDEAHRASRNQLRKMKAAARMRRVRALKKEARAQ